VWPDAFANALLQAQQATGATDVPPLPTEAAASESAERGDLIGSEMSVTSTLLDNPTSSTPAERALPPVTVPDETSASLTSQPSTSSSEAPSTTADDGPRPPGGGRATPGTTSRPTTTGQPPTTNDPNVLTDLFDALFPGD
jgi:hypothetical protein